MGIAARNRSTHLIVGLLAAGMPGLAVAAPMTGMQAAFHAAFGAAPPSRHVKFPDGVEVAYQLAPVSLVHLDGTRYALIASETANAAHGTPGAAAVAYLDDMAGNWRVFRVWYEFIAPGSSGVPFIETLVYQFGGAPIFAGVGEYCGDGACTRWYSLIGLAPDGPADWGFLHDAGTFDPGFDDLRDGVDGLTGCGGYAYSSAISAPARPGDVLRVTYRGWMLPGGGGQRRRKIAGSSEISVVDGKLVERPEVAIPNCGQ